MKKALMILLFASFFFGVSFALMRNTKVASEPRHTFSKEAFEHAFNPYAEYFDIDKATMYSEYQETHSIFIQEATTYGINPNLAFAIVAPEMLRYSGFNDFIETQALELLYTKHGTQGADFSIGSFQIKPSFAEEIEKHFPNQFRQSNNKSLRINRLKNIKDQVKYICLFCKYMDKKYSDKVWKSRKDKVQFYATTYNLGMYSSEKKINQWKNIKAFPYGGKFGTDQCSYAHIAYDMYELVSE